LNGYKQESFLFAMGFNTLLRERAFAALRFANTNNKMAANPALNNLLAERALSIRQRLQDTPPLAAIVITISNPAIRFFILVLLKIMLDLAVNPPG
jgi:hypothetical protein